MRTRLLLLGVTRHELDERAVGIAQFGERVGERGVGGRSPLPAVGGEFESEGAGAHSRDAGCGGIRELFGLRGASAQRARQHGGDHEPEQPHASTLALSLALLDPLDARAGE